MAAALEPGPITAERLTWVEGGRRDIERAQASGGGSRMAFSSYIIAATPRSGSTELCDLLAGTGLAGLPRSYYRRDDVLDHARTWGVSSPDLIGDVAFERAYLETVRRVGSAQSAVFGLRLMWPTVAQLSARLSFIHPDPLDDAGRFELAFGKPLYIHLSRQDKVAQAVSGLGLGRQQVRKSSTSRSCESRRGYVQRTWAQSDD